MKRFLTVILLGMLLTACQPTATPLLADSSPDFVCNTPGSFEIMSLEEPTRGYPYKFGLYLPPCYGADVDRYYPVLIQIPGRGGSPSDFFNVGGVELADEMIIAGDVPPFIIVTTENTDRDSERNAETIWIDLIPHIETHYRVKPEREYHAVSGTSLGGIATYRLVFQHPDRFASAALFGSGAIAGEEEQIQTWLAAIEQENAIRVFFDSGEGDPYMLDRAKVLAGLLDEVEIPYVLNSGEGGHTYDYWMKNMRFYLTWAAEDWE